MHRPPAALYGENRSDILFLLAGCAVYLGESDLIFKNYYYDYYYYSGQEE